MRVSKSYLFAGIATVLLAGAAFMVVRAEGRGPQEDLIDHHHQRLQAALSDLTMTEEHVAFQINQHGIPFPAKRGPVFGARRAIELSPTKGSGGSVSKAPKALPPALSHQRLGWDLMDFKGDGDTLYLLLYGSKTAPLTKQNLSFSQEFIRLAGTVPYGTTDDIATWELKRKQEDLQDFARESFEEVSEGGSTFRKDGRWEVYARAVKLTRNECLRCHTDSKLGDTAGVAVYATPAKN